MQVIRRNLVAIFLSVVAVTAAGGSAFGQPWPQRTVRLIVPLPPGTAVDVSARVYAERLAAIWGQPVVVDNRPGADGIIAAREFAGRHDNHALMYSFAGLITINPLLYATLPYDPARDLVPIAISSDNCLGVAVSSRLGVATLPELLTLAQSRVERINWAATSGLPYFAFAGLQKATGVEMVYVAYRDFSVALGDLREGRIDVVSTALTQLLQHMQAGSLKLVAVINRTRCPLAPDVPTTSELGYPALAFDGITGFFGWRGMSAELRQRIAADVRTIAAEPAVATRFAPIGVVARAGTSAEFSAAIEEQRVMVAKVAAAIGSHPAP